MSLPPAGSRPWPALLVALAVLLALLGQYQFTRTPQPLSSALLLFTLAVVCLLAAERLAQPTRGAEALRDPAAGEEGSAADLSRASALPRLGPAVLARKWRWVLTGVALLLGAWVVWALSRKPLPLNKSGPVVPWLLACALLVAAWGERPRTGRVRAWLSCHRDELAVLTLVTLAALGLRLWQLGNGPFTLSGDEGSIGLELRRILEGELRNPFTLGFGPFPTLSFFVEVVPAWIVGLNAWTLRLPNALLSTLAVPALYALGGQLFGRRTALAAALLLASYQVHLHYSRVALHVAADTFFFTATMAVLIYGLRHRTGPWLFVLAGLLAGADQYVYTGSRLLPLLIVAFLGLLVLVAPEWVAGQRTNLLVLALTFLVVAGPILLVAIQHPNDYNARINQVGIIQSGWLAREREIRHQGTLPILLDQFRRALFGFSFYQDRTVSYGSGGPLANAPMAILLYLGLGLSLLRWQQSGFALLSLWFWGGLIGGGALTVNPPTSNRLVAITPAVVLLAAVALSESARLLAVALDVHRPRRWALAVTLVVAVFLALLDARFYFQKYLPSHRFGGGEALIATQLGYDLARLSPAPHLYFFGPPRMWSGFSTLVFLAPEVPRDDVVEPLTTPEALDRLVRLDRDAFFIFLPERAGERALVARRYPSGEMREARSPDDRKVIYYWYFVPRSALGG
ncbi:MAG: glycosyltransferase family 39 protein [Ardenticatenaceae bacterium]|nr:glycosyltransferase family 39 protein [Ardenticatenaceae bacterium]